MIYAMSGTQALRGRVAVKSPGTGVEHWGAQFFGPRYSTESSAGPQALMSELSANETLLPHFHGTTQFQIFIAGSGKMGTNEIRPLLVQYKDHHTAYGPVVAGPQGLSFIALRIKTADSSPVYLSKPGSREKLKPSKRRNLLSSPIVLSTEPVLEHRKEVSWEPIYDTKKYDDELAAHVVRLGAGMSAMGPDPKGAGGYYLFVANGSLDRADEDFPLWSMVVVESDEDSFEIKAGKKGLEALVMEFPRETEPES